MYSRLRAIVDINIAMILMSFATLFAVAIDWPAAVLVYARMGVATIALLIFLLFMRRSFVVSRRVIVRLIPLALLLGTHWILLFLSAQISSVAISVVTTVGMLPIFAAFLEPLIHREPLKFADVVVAVMALIGIATMIDQFSWQSNDMQGALLGLLSSFCMALRGVYSRSLVRKNGGVVIMFWQLCLGSMLFSPVLLFFSVQPSIDDFFKILFLGIVVTAVAHTLLLRTYRVITVRTATVISNTNPLYATLYAALLLGQWPTARVLVGGAIVLAAAVYESMRGE